MAQSFAKHFYNSREWIKCRNAYIKYRQSRDGGLCEECHEKTGYIVHHKIPLSEDNIENPNIALDFNNLKYVCLDCHNEEHNGGKIEGMVKYVFSPDGEVIPVAGGKRQTPP